MKVQIDLPGWAEKLLENKEKNLLCVAFDISGDSPDIADGYTVLTRDNLYVLCENKIISRVPLVEIEELKAEQMIGSGRLVCSGSSGERVLCHFTQRLFAHFAEFSDAFKYYTETGNVPEIEVDAKICEKCGRPLRQGSNVCPWCMKKLTAFLRILPLCRLYRKEIAIVTILAAVSEIVRIILPYLQRIMIDDYINPATEGAQINFLGFFAWGIGGIIIQLLFMLTWSYEFKTRNKFMLSISRNIKQDLFKKVQYLSSSTSSKYSSGELQHRLQHDVRVLEQFIGGAGIEMIIRVFSFIFLAIMMFVTNPLLTLIVIAPFPFIYILVKKITLRIRFLFHKAWHQFKKTGEALHDILNGIRVVKAYGNEKKEIERFAGFSEKNMRSTIKAELFWAKFYPFISFFVRIGEFIVIYFGAQAVLNKTMMLGELTQYITYVSMMYIPLFWIIHLPRQLTRAGISASKTFELMDEPDELEDEKREEHDIRGEVVFDNVVFGYKPYSKVLKNISFKIKPGEIIGIVGPSGVGKTTLINLIMRLYDAQDGKILVDGTDVTAMDKKYYKNQLGVVLQETFLFDGSILSNLKYSDPNASFEQVIMAAKIAHAHDFISKLPDGYNTWIGDRGYTLSGGERQRIAIARAILHNPKILVLDEATSSLDAETEKYIQEALDKLIKGRTTFAIAHRLSTLRNADRLIVLEDGEISEIGSHIELMRNRGIYYNLVMAQRQTAKIQK
ncbi:MAG: ABC transporter ATP-binding protein/permease [Oscillospiraceae bacterium]|nr:ABC transporter ATP-binding protein/permease [Oscillospiraceae bacterium]